MASLHVEGNCPVRLTAIMRFHSSSTSSPSCGGRSRCRRRVSRGRCRPPLRCTAHGDGLRHPAPRARDVARQRDRVPSRLADGRRRLLRAGEVHVPADDLAALLGEPRRRGPADAGARPGDEDRTPLEPSHARSETCFTPPGKARAGELGVADVRTPGRHAEEGGATEGSWGGGSPSPAGAREPPPHFSFCGDPFFGVASWRSLDVQQAPSSSSPPRPQDVAPRCVRSIVCAGPCRRATRPVGDS